MPSVRRRAPDRLGRWVEWLLGAFCLAMLAAMWRYIAATTIPYHFLFLAIGLVYGFRVWPLGRTAVVIGAVSIATGTIFVRAYRMDLIELDELSEIILMPMLLLAMIWHARRRDEAMRRAQRVAAENLDLMARQHESLRDTSHAIRTPTAIAQGFVELALAATDEPEVVESLTVVARQLDRTEVLSARLLSLAALDEQGISRSDLVLLSDTVRRAGAEWSGRGDRDWRVHPGCGLWVRGDEAALEGAIDALMENALHHTGAGDVITLTCRADAEQVVVEVGDSGPGVSACDVDLVFQRFWHTAAPNGSIGSGLGLSMVEAVAAAHGGSATVGRSDDGGALFTMGLPRQDAPRRHADPSGPESRLAPAAAPDPGYWTVKAAGSPSMSPLRATTR